MTVDPLVLAGDVDRATERMLATAGRVEDVAAPSRLPGWTRGHVLTHIARNADGATNLLTWARTGVVTPQYESLAARAAGIEAGAPRPAQAQLTDLAEACARFAEAARIMPAEAWSRLVRFAGGAEQTAAWVIWSRLKEVEIHHVDLGLDYGPADWPLAFALRLMRTLAADLSARADVPPMVIRSPEVGHDLPMGANPDVVVAGPVWAAAAWLTGRGGEGALTVTPPGSLPAVPAWS